MGTKGNKHALMQVIILVFFSTSVLGYGDPATVRFDDFDVGNSVTFTFTAPTAAGGVIFIRLIDDVGDFVVHIAIRYDLKYFNINNYVGGQWGREGSRLQGFDYTLGAHTSVTVKALEDSFEIFQNEESLGKMAYGPQPCTAKSAAFIPGGGSIQSIGVNYPTTKVQQGCSISSY